MLKKKPNEQLKLLSAIIKIMKENRRKRKRGRKESV